MKAEIPISYIVAIIIGIAVIALLGFWFFTTGGSFNKQFTQQDCINLKSSFCTIWMAGGYLCKDKKYYTDGCGSDNPPIIGNWEEYGGKGGFCSSSFGIGVASSDDCKELATTSVKQTP